MRNDLNADKHVINMTSGTINDSQDLFYTEDLKTSTIFISHLHQ